MNNAHPLLREVTSKLKQSESSIASWYTQGRSDGFGDRLLMFDNSGAPSFELLRFRRELIEAPGFERALRERVELLDQFRHPVFPHVRAVERLDDSEGLALVSTYAAGKRMSEMFQGPRAMGLHPAFAIWLVRQITPALAELQRQGDDVSHGIISADRIVLTPDGSLIIVEHVLAGALQALDLSSIQLWSDFGVLTPPSSSPIARLDRRVDVVQVALIALSVLLGRRITPAEYPQNLDSLLDEFSETATRRSPSLVPPLRLWLSRALGVGDTTFNSAEEALEGLIELPNHPGSAAIGQIPPPPARTPLLLKRRERELEDSSSSSFDWLEQQDKRGSPAEQGGLDGQGSAMTNTAAGAGVSSSSPSLGVPERNELLSRSDAHDMEALDRNSSSVFGAFVPALTAVRRPPLQYVAAALAVLAIIEAIIIGRLVTRPTATASVPVVIESPQSGDVVIVDGHPTGVTPLQLQVGSNVRSIRVVGRTPLPVEPAPLAALERTPSAQPATPAVLPAANRSGGLRIASPIDVKILEGDRVLGSSSDGPVTAAAGVHQFDFVNSEFGYRSHQTVTIRAGQIAPMTLTPADGQMSINASPWAQVWIDGRALGETPLANITVPTGRHEVIFRHPQLGERRESVVVRSGALTRVSATFPPR